MRLRGPLGPWGGRELARGRPRASPVGKRHHRGQESPGPPGGHRGGSEPCPSCPQRAGRPQALAAAAKDQGDGHMHLAKRRPGVSTKRADRGRRLVLGPRGRAGWGERELLTPVPPRPLRSGAAGLVCAETLRQEGFSDRIVLCTLDRHLPYDRPKLSRWAGREWL